MTHPLIEGQELDYLLQQEVIEFMLPDSDFRFVIQSPSLRENLLVTLIEKRLNDIEAKVFKTKKEKEITRAQKMLLLHKLGMLEPLLNLDIQVKQKAKLLSILLDFSAENIEGNLSEILNEKNTTLDIASNYEFLITTFKSVDLKMLEEKAKNKLEEIKKRSQKQK